MASPHGPAPLLGHPHEQASGRRAAVQPLPGRRAVYCRVEGEGDEEVISVKRQILVFSAWSCFLLLLFYTTGLSIIIPTVAQQCGVVVPVWLMQFLFPISHGKFVQDAKNEFDMVNQNYLIIAIPWFLGSLIWEALMVSVILPKKYRPLHGYRLNDTISSLSLGVLNLLMAQLVFLDWAALLFKFVYDHARVTNRFTDPSEPLAWWLCFIMHDALYYLYHRWSHWFSWLWTSHVVHHSSEEYNLSTALRQPANSFFTPEALVSTTGMAFFFPPELVVLHGQLGLLYQFWIHTQLVPAMPRFELLFNSPALHRIHHARNVRALGKNYGSFFSIWDRLGGTFEDERNDTELLHYGIIPPLNSWNPVWANLHHWHHMLVIQWNWHGFRGPFVHWTPPGSSCPKLGSRLNPRNKFDLYPTMRGVRCLVIIEFVLTVIGVAYALLGEPSLAFLDWMPSATAKNAWYCGLFVLALMAFACIATLESAETVRALRLALAYDLVRTLAFAAIALGLAIQAGGATSNWAYCLIGGYTVLNGLAIMVLILMSTGKSAALAAAEPSADVCEDSARDLNSVTIG